jgi:hypothetical protein
MRHVNIPHQNSYSSLTLNIYRVAINSDFPVKVVDEVDDNVDEETWRFARCLVNRVEDYARGIA